MDISANFLWRLDEGTWVFPQQTTTASFQMFASSEAIFLPLVSLRVNDSGRAV
jgi:hypothetical protein